MVKLDKAEIEFLATDKVSKILQQIEKNTRKAEKTTKKSVSAMEKFYNSLKNTVNRGISVAIGNLTSAITQELARAFRQGITDALAYEQSFIVLNQQVEDAEGFLEELRVSTKGLASDLVLVQSANRALSFGLEKDAIPALAETAVALGKIQGLEADQAFNDIVTGIARASPMILDNLGIILDAETTYRQWGEAQEIVGRQLTKNEKLLALQDQTIKNSRILVLKEATAIKSLAEEWKEFNVQQENFFRNVAVNVAESFRARAIADQRQTEIIQKRRQLEENDPIFDRITGVKGLAAETQLLNVLEEELLESESKFNTELEKTNTALTDNANRYKELGRELDNYKTDLDEARTSLQKLLNEQTQEQVDNDKEILKLKRDQLVVNKAIAEAGAEGQGFITKDQSEEIQKFLDNYNERNNTNIEFTQKINDEIEKRIELLRQENELADVERNLFNLERENEIQKALTGEEINRAENFQDFQKRFQGYVEEDIPTLVDQISNVQTDINSISEDSERVLRQFTDMAGQLQLSAFYADRLQKILTSLDGARIEIDIEADFPRGELLDTGG